MKLTVKSFYGVGFGSNCYVIVDQSMRYAAVVDPSMDYDRVVSALGFIPSFQAILLTHGHADHLLSIEDWKTKTGAPVMIGAPDAYALGRPEASCAVYLGLGDLVFPSPDILLSHGDTIPIGDESLTVLSTPGHSVGSVCYLGDSWLLSGDTIFADGGVGRSDLFGGDECALYASVSALIHLPEETIVYPGHGAKTTVGIEAMFHSYLL